MYLKCITPWNSILKSQLDVKHNSSEVVGQSKPLLLQWYVSKPIKLRFNNKHSLKYLHGRRSQADHSCNLLWGGYGVQYTETSNKEFDE